jgi:hypothetical protein
MRRAGELAKEYPPAHDSDLPGWKNSWIKLLEPMEEMAAEHTCIERYQAAFGPLPDGLLYDSRGDMKKYSALYRDRFAAMLKQVRDPKSILAQFPPELPIDAQGNILS